MKLFRFGLGIILAFLLNTSHSIARELTVDEKISDLEQMVARIKSGYGPLHFKKRALGIDVDALHAKYSARIANTKTNGEFYYELSMFIAEFRDGHFSARVPTSHIASLPFTVDLVQGKVLIDEIASQLAPGTFNFSKGDEVVEFNGKPVQEELDKLKPYISMANDQSRERLAAMSLTVRSGARMPVPTNNLVSLKVRRGTSSIIETVELRWNYSGTPLDEFQPAPALLNSSLLKGFNYDDLSTFSSLDFLSHPAVERSYRCSAGTRIAIPKDATVIMKAPFVAYYYPTAAGNIGYLRIPHYVPEMFTSGANTFSHYEYAISLLEKNTVGLIIDQDHNCGGSVMFMHEMVSLFADKPFPPTPFELLASKEEHLTFQGWLAGMGSQTTTLFYKNIQAVADLVKSSWEKGDFLTPKISIFGDTEFTPHKIRYTKPIIVLIDEVSGSGGDAFPSLMQGIGRAKLLGSTTMGLGGHVIELPPLYYSQVFPRMTRSLFYRPDGVPVENNGAVPDISYSPTRDDFMYEYKLYREFYTSKLIELIASQTQTTTAP